MSKKYRKKPVVVEAWRFDGTTQALKDESTPEWLDQAMKDHQVYFRVVQGVTSAELVMEIKTLEGYLRAAPGDYVIRGVQGELYPCKPDIFEETYEEVPDGEEI